MKLHEQVTELKYMVRQREDAINEIMDYVLSSKFDSDNLCNVNDIVLRLEEHKRDFVELDG
jgi:hypothetical protein